MDHNIVNNILHLAGHFYHIGGGNIMTAADFAALYGSTEEITEPSMRDNFFYTEEVDDDEGAEWD